jgi:hypothetical protein
MAFHDLFRLKGVSKISANSRAARTETGSPTSTVNRKVGSPADT